MGRQRAGRLRWRRTGRLLGAYAADLATSSILFSITLLFSALIAALVEWMTTIVRDPDFLLFARLTHIILLCFDALLLLAWLIRWLVQSSKEWP
jgi:hypothetical protein